MATKPNRKNSAKPSLKPTPAAKPTKPGKPKPKAK